MKTLRTAIIVAVLTVALGVSAQDGRKFSPQKFEADMEAFITSEAQLTAQEAAAYFPLLRELHKQQRGLMGGIAKRGKQKPSTEQEFIEAVRFYDESAIESKRLEQQFHARMLKVIPASKLYAAIKAENKFHRQMMKGMMRHKPKADGGQPRGRRQ